MRSKEAVAIAVTVLLSFSCSRKGSEAQHARSAGTYVDEFSIGSGVSAKGVAIDQKNTFKQGEPIYASFVVQNAPDGAKARVVWANITKGMTPVAQDEKSLGTKGFVSFKAADTSTWEPDNYRLEIILVEDPSKPGRSLGINDFKVVPVR